MAYTFPNPSNARAISLARFWDAEACEPVTAALNRVNFTVVESLRDGKAALETFLQAGRHGHKIANGTTRWPATDPMGGTCYVTNYDGEFTRITNGLNAAMSERTGSQTREEANQSARQPGPSARPPTEDESKGANHANKAFSELRAAWLRYIVDPNKLWHQERFEQNAPAVWA